MIGCWTAEYRIESPAMDSHSPSVGTEKVFGTMMVISGSSEYGVWLIINPPEVEGFASFGNSSCALVGVFADAPPERGPVIWFSLFWEYRIGG